MAYVIDERDAEKRDMRVAGGVSHRLINETTGSRYVDITVNVLPAGSGPGPYHYHSNVENIYYVLEGTAQITIDERKVIAGPGLAIWIPPNERHRVENVGEGDLRLIEIKAPSGGDFLLVTDDELP